MWPNGDIDPGMLEMVDLNIEYSPVIAYPGWPQCEAIKQSGDFYIVIHDSSKPAASAQKVYVEELRIMRLRYLLVEGERKTRALNSWLKR